MSLAASIKRLPDAFWRLFLPRDEEGYNSVSFRGARMTWKRLRNIRRLEREFRAGAVKLKSRPVKLVIEATNVCNLRCTACFTGVGENGRVRSAIDMELYRRILDEIGDTLIEIEFYNWGEPFLNKSISEMIELASRKGILTTISTNFSVPFDEARAEAVVKAGLSVLGVSLDGATQDNYEKYRRGGDLALVLRNAQMIIDAKRRLGSATPVMIWSFHDFAHNVDEVEDARAMSEAMGFDSFSAAKGLTYGDEWDDDRYRFFIPPYAPTRCGFLWNYAVIHNDGGIASCCGAFYREDDFGRLSAGPGLPGAKSFAEVWNGEKFQAVRGLYAARVEDLTPSCGGLCDECPQTLTYQAGLRHVASGKTMQTFEPIYSPNDGHNYFRGRRPEGRDTKKALRPERV
jgi:MoaA/NifB/PqqE/SkfB family radical SAM enzyme